EKKKRPVGTKRHHATLAPRTFRTGHNVPEKIQMALLQISEPGMAPAPHQRRLAVGIDLGTTNSLVAAVRSGSPDVLPDEDGHVLLPSVVRYLEQGGRRIGRKAKAEAASDPRNTIVSVKRFMGRGKAEVEGAENAPYDFVDAP